MARLRKTGVAPVPVGSFDRESVLHTGGDIILEHDVVVAAGNIDGSGHRVHAYIGH